MADLILTEEEKRTPLWTDMDDATLGKLLRKEIYFLYKASEQIERTIIVAAGLLLCGSVAENNAAEMELNFDGLTERDGSIGDWTVIVKRRV